MITTPLNIHSLKDHWHGRNVFLLGCGLNGEKWQEYIEPDELLLCTNSSFPIVGHRADAFITVETSAYEFAWARYTHPERYSLKFIHQDALVKIVRGHPGILQDNAPIVPINRARGYRNVPLILSADLREYKDGLITGPLCYPGYSTGTVLLQGLHLARYLGAKRVRSIGFGFVGFGHWTTDEQDYHPNQSFYLPQEVFVKVAGRETFWEFAMSASICKRWRPAIEARGMEWIDYSGGLMDVPGIERLIEVGMARPGEVNLAAMGL